jgi:two-component system, NtrC family, sensor kinase
MRLTRKFIAALVIGVALVAMIQAFFDYRRERAVFDSQMRAEATALGRALARGVAEVWDRDGEAAARQFLLTASSKSEHIRARWVWLDEETRDRPSARTDILAPMQEGQVVVYKDVSENALLTYIPVRVPVTERDGDLRQGGLEIAQPLTELDRFTADSLRNGIIASVAAVVIAGLLALVLGFLFIGRPVSRLAEKARRVGTGDLTGPLKLAQRDELGQLATEINLMCERLAAERSARESATEQLRHADRLTTVGKLASGLAHELGTPLNVVQGRARLISDGEVEGEDIGTSARIVVEQAERMTALIRQLLDFARPRPLHKAPLNAPALVARVCELVGTIARKARVTLQQPPIDDSLRVEADEGQLHQVVTNLVINAIHAMPDGGSVELSVRTAEQAPPAHVDSTNTRWIVIAIRDQGIGMTEDTRSRIFEPFFTTKGAGEGTGLGLSVSWGIVREHGGWIDVQSAAGTGSTFEVFLPRGAQGVAAA